MPRPTLLEPAQAYALWAASYPPQPHNAVMQAEQRAMLARMPATLAGLAVLDAGCGSGRYLLHALQRGAAQVTGVDLAAAMLARARSAAARAHLARGSLAALPLLDGCVDLSICALTIGHLPDLRRSLAELGRVTRRGGTVLVSQFHPIGHALGWTRDFKADGRHYAVRQWPHLYSHWHDACASLGLDIEAVAEAMLDPDDIPAGAHFDPAALDLPVALVLRLRRH